MRLPFKQTKKWKYFGNGFKNFFNKNKTKLSNKFVENTMIKNDALIEINAIFEESKVWICGSQTKSFIFFEFLHPSLLKEIKNRMKNKVKIFNHF
jgi:hypothetical protein